MSREDAPKDNGWTLVQKCLSCDYCAHSLFHVCPSCGARVKMQCRDVVARWVSTRRWWSTSRKGYWKIKEEE